jgi:dihydrodipicolinate synthase/N-acetylneuraminate lyase
MAEVLNRKNLRGLIPPMVTPIQMDGGLDVSAIGRLVEHMVGGGVSGLFILGTCGEGAALSYRKRYQFVEFVCEAARGRVPVLVSVSDTSYEEAVDLAEHAYASGASAVVSTGPFFLSVPMGHLETYFERLAEESRLPVVLYNMPGCTKFCLDPTMVARLAQHPKIIGIKDSSGDLKYIEQLIQAVSPHDFPVLIGPEEILIQAMRLGAVGGVNGGGVLFPGVYAARIAAFAAGDTELAAKADRFVQRFSKQIFPTSSGRMAVIEAMKQGLAAMGLCQPWVLSPLQPLDSEHRQRIERKIAELEIEAAEICSVLNAERASGSRL